MRVGYGRSRKSRRWREKERRWVKGEVLVGSG